MKKTISLLIALVLILGLAMPAFAADTTLNISGGEGRTFNAYKLMDASVDSEGGNYFYAVNDTYRDLLAACIANGGAVSEEAKTDEAIIAALKDLDDAAMRKLADSVYRSLLAGNYAADATFNGTAATLPQGYWLIADVTDLSGSESGSNSLVMVDTVGDKEVTIATKLDVPEMVKKVDDKNDSNTSEDGETWQDSADYDIGDAVPYQITVTLPNNIENYETYYFLISDRASKGLTFNADSFAITVGGASKTIGAEGVTGVDFNYSMTTNEAGETTLKLYPAGNDMLKVGAKNNNTVVFTYTCTLNENAVFGAAGNPNVAYLEYSNNPYDTGDGEGSHGKTPDDVCIVFTYKTIFNKVDGNNAPLAGADFELYKFVVDAAGTETYNGNTGSWVMDDSKVVTDGVKFTFSGLDDGNYKLIETVTPAGYNGLPEEGLFFTITAEHVVEFDAYSESLLTSLNGTEDVAGTITLTPNVTEGELESTVVNQSGAELPSTGGIGTTIFYVLGTILVIGTAVLMITKKRMGVEE